MVTGGAFQLNTIQIQKFATCLRTLRTLQAVKTGTPLATTHIKMLCIMNGNRGTTTAVHLLTLVKIRNFNESKTWDINIYNEKLMAKEITFYAPAY